MKIELTEDYLKIGNKFYHSATIDELEDGTFKCTTFIYKKSIGNSKKTIRFNQYEYYGLELKKIDNCSNYDNIIYYHASNENGTRYINIYLKK